jgi:DNA polymerase III alpha subunit
MKILRRNVSKDEFKNFLNKINLEDKNLYKEVSDNQCFIFQFSGGTASRMVADARPENFDDMICLNAYSRPGASFGFGNFCLIKNEGQKSVYPEQIQQFLKDGRGTICFQEQCMAICSYLSPNKKQITITLSDGSKRIFDEDDKVKTNNGYKKASELTENDEIIT